MYKESLILLISLLDYKHSEPKKIFINLKKKLKETLQCIYFSMFTHFFYTYSENWNHIASNLSVDADLFQRCELYYSCVLEKDSPYRRTGNESPRTVLKQLHDFGFNINLNSIIDNNLSDGILGLDDMKNINLFIISSRKNPVFITKKSSTVPTIAIFKYQHSSKNERPSFYSLSISDARKKSKIYKKLNSDQENKEDLYIATLFTGKQKSLHAKHCKNTISSRDMALYSIEQGM
jgi:hypothetical protein